MFTIVITSNSKFCGVCIDQKRKWELEILAARCFIVRGKEAKCAMTLVMTPLYIKLGFMLVLGLNIDENAANIHLCTHFNYSSVSDRNKQFH